MATQIKSQGLLFSEPSIAETGVWCELADGIDPGEWASLYRYIGGLRPKEFGKVKRKVVGRPNSLLGRLKRVFCFEQEEFDSFPLVKVGKLI